PARRRRGHPGRAEPRSRARGRGLGAAEVRIAGGPSLVRARRPGPDARYRRALVAGAGWSSSSTNAARGMVASAEDTTAAERPPAEPPEVDPYPEVRPPSRADGSPTVTAPARDGTDLNVA